jgi:hypothetical protein
MRTRTARLLTLSYLGFIVYMDLASGLARSGAASMPLGISDPLLFGEVSIVTHVIGVVLIIVLFVLLKQPQISPVRGSVY